MTCPPNTKVFLKTKHPFVRPLCFRKNLPIYFLLNVLCFIYPFQLSNISPKRQKSKTQNFPKLLGFQWIEWRKI